MGDLPALAINFRNYKFSGFPITLLKKNSGTSVFLWILLNFLEHLFHRTPPGDCCYKELESGYQKCPT